MLDPARLPASTPPRQSLQTSWFTLLFVLFFALANQSKIVAQTENQNQTPINPDWVYMTQPRWVHAVPAAGIDERTSYATILVLYPSGQFAEVSAALLEHGRERSVTLSNTDGVVLRGGTWSHPDDDTLLIQARELFRSIRSPERIRCDPDGTGCTPIAHPLPGPLVSETCSLVGHPTRTHLARAVQCRRVSATPLRINLSLADLANLIATPR